MTDPSWPPVSVVVAARNEERTIERAVRSALDQDYPGPLDVIVADGDSNDGTRSIIEQIGDERVILVDNPDRHTAAGLNRAIRAARGEVVVRCDGHAVLPSGYVSTAVRVLRDTGAGNVGGIQAATGTTLFARAVALAMTSRLGVGDSRFHLGGRAGPVDTVYLGVFDRAKLDAVGLYDETLVRNQDYELNHRLREAGHIVWFTPELVVEYQPRGSLIDLSRQYFDYGRWKRAMLTANPSAVRWRQLVPPLFVLTLAVSLILLLTGHRAFGMVIPLAYATALVLGTLWSLVVRRSVSAVLLPIVLPTMHVAWGSGFLIGPPAK
ncbi:MAG: glycosyltransferase family 2 protein [Acidimicrobiia bacterium]|nr:glycosyltransferase family 2 protein [Acidimicrobiia bacterium]